MLPALSAWHPTAAPHLSLAAHLASHLCRFPFCPRRLRQLAALFRVDWDAADSEQLYALADMMNNAAAAADPPGVSEPLPAALLALPSWQPVMPAMHGNPMLSCLPCHAMPSHR
jgi:hypothetical protein